jgi:hypothetical protein
MLRKIVPQFDDLGAWLAAIANMEILLKGARRLMDRRSGIENTYSWHTLTTQVQILTYYMCCYGVYLRSDAGARGAFR